MKFLIKTYILLFHYNFVFTLTQVCFDNKFLFLQPKIEWMNFFTLLFMYMRWAYKDVKPCKCKSVINKCISNFFEGSKEYVVTCMRNCFVCKLCVTCNNLFSDHNKNRLAIYAMIRMWNFLKYVPVVDNSMDTKLILISPAGRQ